MKVKEIMTKEVISVDKDEDLKHVLDLMKKHDITKIPVVEDKKIMGIVTDNLIAYKLGSIRKRGISTSRLHASSVTEKEIEAISPNTDVKKILKMVGKPGPTMLPVVEKDKLVGVVTKADLLFLVDSKKTRSVSVTDAAKLMMKHHIGSLPVIEDDILVGIVTRTDLLKTVSL